MTILHIDSSINGDGSASRELSRSIVDKVRQSNWGEELVYRDLAANSLPHLTLDAFADTTALDDDTDWGALYADQAAFETAWNGAVDNAVATAAGSLGALSAAAIGDANPQRPEPRMHSTWRDANRIRALPAGPLRTDAFQFRRR